MQKDNKKITEPVKNGLNGQQECFCQEYVVDLNPSAAYLRAGYVTNHNGAWASASRLLRDVKVKARIQELTLRQLAQGQFVHTCLIFASFAAVMFQGLTFLYI